MVVRRLGQREKTRKPAYDIWREQALDVVDKYAPLLDIPNFSREAVDALLKHGALVSKQSDFGDEEMPLACNGIAWGMPHAASGASKCLGGALIHAASQATKLELIVVLSSEVWESRNIATTSVRNHGPWLVSLSMVQCSKKYFEALVEAQSLFSRGVPAIAHGMPDNY